MRKTHAPRLSAAAEERSMRLSVVEGVVYALMVGFGEMSFTADAIRLGASALELGLVVSLPLFIGAAGPLLALALLGRSARRKPLVVGAVVLQAAILAGLGVLDGTGLGRPWILVVGACAYQVCGQAAGVAWASWYGDLVPEAIRGSYFARRNRAIHVATCAGLLVSGFVLQSLEHGSGPGGAAGAGGIGFLAVFLVAAGFRLVSAALLARSPEPRFRGLPSPERLWKFLRTGRGSGAWRILTGGAVLQLAVYVSSPFFGPYMFQELHFSYQEFTIGQMSVVATKFLTFPLWGKVVDRQGPRGVYHLAAVMVALVPIPWLWTDGLAWAVVAQVLSGFSWAGHELSYFTLLLRSSWKRTRPVTFAAQSICNGSAQLVGGLLGGALMGGTAQDFHLVFAVSTAARLAVALAIPAWARDSRGGGDPGRGAVLLQVIGFRPGGGLVHRAVEPRRRPPSRRS